MLVNNNFCQTKFWHRKYLAQQRQQTFDTKKFVYKKFFDNKNLVQEILVPNIILSKKNFTQKEKR